MFYGPITGLQGICPKYFVLSCVARRLNSCTCAFVSSVLSNVIFFLSLQRRAQSSSRSKSEYFHPQMDDAVSGLRVAAPKQSRTIKEARIDYQVHLLKRDSPSGPHLHGPGQTKSGKELDDPPAIPTAAYGPTLSGPSRPGTLTESRMKQDQKHHKKLDGGLYDIDGKSNTKELSPVRYFSCFFLLHFFIYMSLVRSYIFTRHS